MSCTNAYCLAQSVPAVKLLHVSQQYAASNQPRVHVTCTNCTIFDSHWTAPTRQACPPTCQQCLRIQLPATGLQPYPSLICQQVARHSFAVRLEQCMYERGLYCCRGKTIVLPLVIVHCQHITHSAMLQAGSTGAMSFQCLPASMVHASGMLVGSDGNLLLSACQLRHTLAAVIVFGCVALLHNSCVDTTVCRARQEHLTKSCEPNLNHRSWPGPNR